MAKIKTTHGKPTEKWLEQYLIETDDYVTCPMCDTEWQYEVGDYFKCSVLQEFREDGVPCVWRVEIHCPTCEEVLEVFVRFKDGKLEDILTTVES